jgi:hypothetical protein
MLLKKLVPTEVCHFLTHLLLRNGQEKSLLFPNHEGDVQVPNALFTCRDSEIFDTLNEIVWSKLETTINRELIPTYSYARIYTNGNQLKYHYDRKSCELSVTVQLGRSHHYAWPIFVKNSRYDLQEGDGVVYNGCTDEHWRNVCDGPENYYSAQVFLHYVYADGPNANLAGDGRWGNNLPFKRNRCIVMDEK